jgi:hypothetical protein
MNTTTVTEPPALLTKKQLAKLLQCSPRHIERLQRERKIPVVRLTPGFVRYSRERVLNALTKFEQTEINR